MMTLTRTSMTRFELINRNGKMIEEIFARDEIDAMSYTAHRFPGHPCELDTSAHDLSLMLEAACMAA